MIWTRVRDFRRRKLYAYYRLIYDRSKDVSSAWCDWALVAFSDAQGIAANDAWRHCVHKVSTELLGRGSQDKAAGIEEMYDFEEDSHVFGAPRRVKDRTLR